MEKLQQELNIEEDEWESILSIPKTIKQTEIQAFQYKLLFNLLPRNLYLNWIKKVIQIYVMNLMIQHITCLSVVKWSLFGQVLWIGGTK